MNRFLQKILNKEISAFGEKFQFSKALTFKVKGSCAENEAQKGAKIPLKFMFFQ